MIGGQSMKFKNWKKNAVAAGVLVTVCAGIYINWHYSDAKAAVNLTDTLNSDKIMSDDLLVMGDSLSNPGSSDSTTMTDYFSALRLSRQKARDSAVSLLQEAMSYGNQEDAAQSSDQLEQIVQTALCEAQIESLVVAKGYTDCVAYMSEKGISVAVAAPEGGLKDQDVAVISDIVMTQSALKMSQIWVVEVK
jgi:stage III sporulation protein AH